MDQDFQFSTGHRLDNFKIVEPLYAGALAEVYRAVDTLTHRAVVIKVPSMDIINNPLVYYHFQNEVHVLDKINHPRIVRLIQRGRSTAYSVFEYISGEELRKRMNTHGIFSVSQAKHYITQSAEGLAYLHGCGIVHLDIKPENIIVTPMDTVKIVDFGLARQLGTLDVLREDFTRPHGTPYYAAPEQLERYRDDPRTDLYSLAMVFYEMLTGRLPFEKSTDLVRVRRTRKDDPVPPRQYRKDLPEEIDAFIIKALSREPENRYPTAEAFIRALALTGPHGISGRGKPSRHERNVIVSPSCPIRPLHSKPGAGNRGILAAIDDNNRAEAVADAALQEALVTGAAVTLLTIVSGDGTDDWIRYADEVNGKRWGHRLEHIVQRFRRCGMEPIVRIRSGSPADIIVETAKANRAELIILGAPGKKRFKRIFRERILARVLKKAPCRVKVAEEPMPPGFPVETHPDAASEHCLRRLNEALKPLPEGESDP